MVRSIQISYICLCKLTINLQIIYVRIYIAIVTYTTSYVHTYHHFQKWIAFFYLHFLEIAQLNCSLNHTHVVTLNTYIHTQVHTYVHIHTTYIHTYVHICICDRALENLSYLHIKFGAIFIFQF